MEKTNKTNKKDIKGVEKQESLDSEEWHRPCEEYIIEVKKDVNGKEKTSIVDVRDVNWEEVSGVWKNDAGWEPINLENQQKLEKWIKKFSAAIKATPLYTDPEVDTSWKEVVEQQKKSEEEFKKKGEATTIPTQKKENEKAISAKLLLLYTTLSAMMAIGLGILYLSLIPNIEGTKEFINSFSQSPIEQDARKDNTKIMDTNKAYFMKYIIEESIWRAKIKASLYNKAQGKTYFHEIKDYTNINATAIEVINTVNKMFEKFDKESNLTINDLQTEIQLFESALKSEENKGKEILCYLTRSIDVSLGTYPSKKVAERANKEKWISPLGSLHEATTGKSHKGRYPTDPNDPRSVGDPVKWKSQPPI